MFQDISQSLVLVVFLWGPLVNRGIRKGTHDIVYELKGHPCACRVSNGDEFGK